MSDARKSFTERGVKSELGRTSWLASPQPFVILLLAVCAGILIDRYCHLPPKMWGTGTAVAWLAWLLLIRHGFAMAAGWSILLSVACISGMWHHHCWHDYSPKELAFSLDEEPRPACLRVRILDTPLRCVGTGRHDRALPTYLLPDEIRLRVQILSVRNGQRWQPADGRALLTVQGDLLDAYPGDDYQVFARARRPSAPSNPGEPSGLEYARSDRNLTRLTAVYPSCLMRINRGSTMTVAAIIRRMRAECNGLLWRHLSPERSGLAGAVLLGTREQLQSEQIDAFLVTGTIHLLAISGLHVAILGAVMFRVARLQIFSRRKAYVVIILMTMLYAALTMARAPVVRASVLICVVCLGWIIRRQASAFNSLSLAAILVLAFNPCQLFQTGAQLSFLAVGALAAFAPRWHGFASDDPVRRLVRRSAGVFSRTWRLVAHRSGELFLASCVVTAVTLPLVMYRWHIVSPIALLLNVVLWIPMATALLTGFGVLLFGWLLPPLAAACSRMCDVSLWILDTTVQQAAQVPLGHWWVTGPTVGGITGFYSLLAIQLLLRPPRMRIALIVLAGVWLIADSVITDRRLTDNRQGKLTATFLAVGHGTCVALELPDGSVVLYDAGAMGDPQFTVQRIARFLWHRRISNIKAIVLSHADADHYNAIPGLLERFPVGTVYTTRHLDWSCNDSLRSVAAALREHHVEINVLERSSNLFPECGATVQAIVPPPIHDWEETDNSLSLVVAITCQDQRILLPGDLEGAGLDRLLKHPTTPYHLIMAPHHGSTRSDPFRVIQWSRPQHVVISGDASSHDEWIDIIASHSGLQPTPSILHTGRHGAVSAVVDSGRLHVNTFRPAEDLPAQIH
ncbi:MAG: ComEC/Rec2 family competence protein [Pirellulaceae bacterium]|nr:ComEC/Rec2 family competence protein [Planctomycetales bacterium]